MTWRPLPNPTPTPSPTGGLLYDSLTMSALHNGVVRRFTQEGNVAPNGKGIQCRASGNPYIQVNADHTFSLINQQLGRFYIYCNNYNVNLRIQCAWWNNVNQDLSLKARSRHNERDPTTNRFGGYGLAVNKTQWDAKREPYHNTHDQSQGGNLPMQLGTQQYFQIDFTVKDMAPKVMQFGYLNAKQFMQKADPSPAQYMVNQSLYAQNSYIWVRQNVNSGTGELRVKRLQLFSV